MPAICAEKFGLTELDHGAEGLHRTIRASGAQYLQSCRKDIQKGRKQGRQESVEEEVIQSYGD
jgi:hypothetical protein